MEKQQVAAAVLSFAYRLDGVNVANVVNVVNVVNGVNCQRFPLRPLPPVLPCCESSLRAGDVPSMGGQPLCVSVRHHIYCVTMALDCGRTSTANIDNCAWRVMVVEWQHLYRRFWSTYVLDFGSGSTMV
jgi:hypothetical protein